MSDAPYPEPQGYRSQLGFVKSNPLNNDHYVEQWKGDPWFPIIEDTHRELTKVIPGYNIAQIKQKFGGLRYYIHMPDPMPLGDKPWNNTEDKLSDRAYALIRYAEAWVDGFEYGRKNK